MGWVITILLAVLIMAGLVLFGRLPRMLIELTGAALLLGIAGYAWQGRPSLPGSARDAAQTAPRFDEDLAKLRDAFGGRYGKAAPWITMSDGFARQGRTGDAANVLASGLRAEPRNADLWVAMGNALIAHSGGVVSPAAQYSFAQATTLAPRSSAAPYFYGLALAQSGQYAEARKVWGDLAARVTGGTPLHQMLQADLAQLDRILSGQSPVQP